MVQKITTLLIALSLFACTKKEAPPPPESTAPELRLFTWSEYFQENELRAFEEQTGIKIKPDYFSSNEQMLAKLQLAAKGSEPGYDLILPSDYMVRTLIELKLLQKLDPTKLPFLADFDAAAKNPSYDPGLQFSVPLAMGVTGLAVNTKLLPKFNFQKEFSWKEAFESPEFSGKLTILDDAKEALQAALLQQGKTLEKASEDDVKKAFATLRARKAQVKAFTAETRPVIESDECGLCMAYSGDVLSVAKDKPEIRFVVPKEGSTLWTDNFAIPANAKNAEAAYKFMSMILSAEGAKAFTERTGYRTANLKAKKLLPKAIVSNPLIYPGPKEMQRLHYLVDRKDIALLVDKEWTLLKSE